MADGTINNAFVQRRPINGSNLLKVSGEEAEKRAISV
jgi:hypothetical protein